MLDFQGLNQDLLLRCRDFLPTWLPGGYLKGKEYTCASIDGGRGGSFSVNTETGAWADFSGTVKGRDLISLYATIKSISNGEAYKELGGRQEALVAPRPVVWPPLVLPNARIWTYRYADGREAMHVTRTETDTGKRIAPYTYDGTKYNQKACATPRPLYNLPKILASDLPVLIVEGETSVDAAQSIVADAYIVTTWPNGATAYNSADWSPLKGRTCLIWPDCDLKLANETTGPKYGIEPGMRLPHRFQPGMAAGLAIAKILTTICPQVKLITFDAQPATTTTEAIPDWAPFDGWDAADALREGWDWDRFASWATPRAVLCRQPDPDVIQPDLPDAPTTTVAPNVNALLQEAGVKIPDKGSVKPNIDTLIHVFSNLPAYQNLAYYDEFHQLIFSDAGRQWTEIDDLNLAFRLQRELGLDTVTDRDVRQGITVYAHGRTRNEPKEWLVGRPDGSGGLVWDGTQRLSGLFHTYFGANDNEYTRAVSENFLISMVARIMEPGCKVDNMVILEGAQGTFKSTALAVLGDKFSMESHESVLSKDFYQTMRGKFLIIINELQSFSKTEVNTIKNLVTRPSDTYRKSYGRDSEDHPRRSIFIGVTNEDHYLVDVTGARRFWPVRSYRIDIPSLKRDRDQLFAEAVHLYQSGASWHSVPAGLAAAEQESRRSHDEWEFHVSEFIHQFPHDKEGVSISKILTACLQIPVGKITRAEQLRIAKILRVFNWKDSVVRNGQNVERLWFPENVTGNN